MRISQIALSKRIPALLALALLLAPPVAAVPESVGGLTLLAVRPRVITPNGDGVNDVAFLVFDTTLEGLPIDSSIYDITGAKVANMAIGGSADALTWNGKDGGGRAVPAGIYLYAVKIGKNVATGTIVVAR